MDLSVQPDLRMVPIDYSAKPKDHEPVEGDPVNESKDLLDKSNQDHEPKDERTCAAAYMVSIDYNAKPKDYEPVEGNPVHESEDLLDKSNQNHEPKDERTCADACQESAKIFTGLRIFYFVVMIICLVMFIIDGLNVFEYKNLWAICVFIITYVIYWIDIFLWNSTFKFLKTVAFVGNIYQHVEQVSNTGVPSITWTIQCYHYETRYRTVTTTDSRGRRHTRTESYQQRVITWSGSEIFRFSSWYDLSPPIASLGEYKFTRIKFHKEYCFADAFSQNSFEMQRQAFVNFNMYRDRFYTTFTSFDISGFIGNAISTTEEEVPACLHLGPYIACCLFLGEIFYGIWLRKISNIVEMTYKKEFKCLPM